MPKFKTEDWAVVTRCAASDDPKIVVPGRIVSVIDHDGGLYLVIFNDEQGYHTGIWLFESQLRAPTDDELRAAERWVENQGE